MHKSFPYEPVLSAKASSFLIGVSKTKQQKIIALIFKISDHPGQIGDYSIMDNIGREIQHIQLGDWQFGFWADHAVRELRITEIVEL